MKIGVVTFPGSNCNDDALHVVQQTGHEAISLWHKSHDLQNVDMVILPGGFSYGDYLRSGAVARFSPIMQEVIQFAENGGYVLGICNGFQVLCEAHLLPGVLLRNANQKFICKNVSLRVENENTLITQAYQKDEVLTIPIAHAEGQYYASKDELRKLQDNGQVLFKYCSATGKVDETFNPNGSQESIAGICNAKGNVFGMMPHPERAAEKVLGNEDGRRMFEALTLQMA